MASTEHQARGVAIRHLRAFVEVARHGSFTAAANRIHISQPGLTSTINQLEDQLGVSLLSRTTRRVDLTADGEDFFPVAERLIHDFDEAIATVRNQAKSRMGTVEIAVVPSLAVNLLPTVIRKFNETSPSINIKLKDDNARGIFHQMRYNEADFALANKWEEDTSLEFTPLFRDMVGLVCLPDHPLAKLDRPLRWSDLEGYRYAGMAPDTGIHPLIQQRTDLPVNVLTPEYEVLTLVALASIVEADLAVTALPASAVPHYTDKPLVFRKLAQPVVEREICIIRRKGCALSDAAQTVLDMLQTHLERPWECLRHEADIPRDAFSGV